MKNTLIALITACLCTFVLADTADDIVGVWYADAEQGDLGALDPYGSLASAGWLSYQLTLNADGSFAAEGMNVFDDDVYGDGDGIIHYSGTYTIDDLQTPMWIDLTVIDSDNSFFPTTPEIQPLQNGIFELNGTLDALTIQYGSELAWGIPRPTEFNAPATLVSPVSEPVVPPEIIGDWFADANAGDLGALDPYGSLASAGWLSYLLTLNDDWSFSAEGMNVFDDDVYGDGDGVIHYSGTFTVDMDQNPMWIDLTVISSDNAFFPTTPDVQPLQNGIFALNGINDEMTIQYGSELAWGIPRPTEFTAPATLVLQVTEPTVPAELAGTWYADSETGDLGVLDPYGSLASAGWLSYMLTLNDDWTFSAEGWNVFDDDTYGDGDGVIHYSGTFTVDIDQTPMWIDLTVTSSDNAFFPTTPDIQPLQNGIFALNGTSDEITIQYGSELAWGIPRPADFITPSTLVLQEPCIPDGDVTGEGNVDILDVVAVIANILGTNPLPLNTECHADVDGNGSIDVLDVVMIVDFILNPARQDYSASHVVVHKSNNHVTMTSNGPVGGIQMVLNVDNQFTLSLNSGAYLADYSQFGSTVRIIIIHPVNELFTYTGKMSMTKIIAASADGYIDVSLPEDYQLLSSYPNPFNPVTQIDYSIPEAGQVNLSVFNIRGQKVATLVNNIQPQGVYSVNWNGAGYPSGLYILKLEAPGTVVSQKITLLK